MKFSSRRSRLAFGLATLLLFTAAACVSPGERNQSRVTITNLGAAPQLSGIDARYTPQALKQAFGAVCQRLGYRPLRLEVDDSEVPFIVYGVLEGRCDYREIRDTVNMLDGYAYVGSVTRVKGDGSVTLFSLNMIPGSSGSSVGDRLRRLAFSQH